MHSACGLDIVLHFTASSDAVLQRASQSGTKIITINIKLYYSSCITTVICENFVVKKFSSRAKWWNFFTRNFFTSNTIYGEYMAHIWYDRKYCYTKISNTKFLRTKSKLMRLRYYRYVDILEENRSLKNGCILAYNTHASCIELHVHVDFPLLMLV